MTILTSSPLASSLAHATDDAALIALERGPEEDAEEEDAEEEVVTEEETSEEEVVEEEEIEG